MQLYPALSASMGSWQYYIVKMRMREVAAEVKFGSEVHSDATLDQAIQRAIKESRVKREIVTYLTGQKDRFFGSLVVAAVGGSPQILSRQRIRGSAIRTVSGRREPGRFFRSAALFRKAELLRIGWPT